MASEYDDITAFHYASYRPPLHRNILTSCLNRKSFTSGLDIGCGTGQSTIALADFCSTVVGIDPSTDMISNGITYPNVSYSLFNKSQIYFDANSFDIITLAGSLWYAKSQKLLDEIVRVGANNSSVLVYDFQVLLNDILTKLGFQAKEDSNGYNHQENFAGLKTRMIDKLSEGCERIRFQMTAQELAHMVLSVKEQYQFFEGLYGFQEVYNTTVEKINAISNSKSYAIEADTFFISYRLK
ncbi:class I SAM-dependent methyltransferase [Maribacter algarum]|uniref:Class I SAM-dependent methyltransferase n=1 Tax=Maribacter algarum (ex Zhang et al. 2020) TaxID=2578118 RepID=A0A5S3PNI9_9FLAO|nr:class I SAM-dependent methyltransferase [Maribacter algarum]TMM55993.1 class I SAM-dependent methyltransferase [Maribacter algarum]